jgi:molybdopterin molybdotransferase
MQRQIEADAARDLLLKLPVTLETERVALCDAVGRVLAEPLVAELAVPPFDKSPYDGYALRGEDTVGASPENPVTLTLTEELPAGTAPTISVTPGTAAKILTGAPIPPGANVTVKYEQTTFTATTVTLTAPLKPDTDIVRTGEDVACGDCLAEAGTVIEPAVAAMLAGQGRAEAIVYRRPRVSLIATGSELIAPGAPLEPAKIYDTNSALLGGYLTRLGMQVRDCGILPDDPTAIAAELEQALLTSELVITTGGASVGDYDWAVRTAEQIGAEVLFWKTAMKPGGSIMAAVKDGKLILGLSGNPGAAVIGLQRVAMPYLKKLCGRNNVLPERFEVFLERDFKKKSPALRMVRGHIKLEDGRAVFCAHDGQGNGAVRSLVGCDVFGEIPAGSPPLPAGSKIWAYRLDV